MKKTLGLLFIMMLMMFGVNVGAEAAAITGTVSLADGITAPDGGMEVKLYAGTNRNVSSGGGFDKYLEYQGYSWDVPRDTIKSAHSGLTYLQTVTIPAGENSVEYSMDTDVNSSNNYQVAAVIDNGNYIGSKSSRVRNQVADITVPCYEKTVISGTVEIPEPLEEGTFSVVAEANRKVVNEYGYYTAEYDFAAVKNISFSESENTFSLDVIKGMDYTVYVVFEDGKYVRQTAAVSAQDNECTAEFEPFELSKKITGTINLPENVTELNYFDGSAVEDLNCTIRLQSASEPYYWLDFCEVTIPAGERSAEFELYDDIGVEDVYISYITNENIHSLYYGGVYADDAKCIPNIRLVTSVKMEDKSVTINMIEAETITFTLDNQPEYSVDLTAIMQTENSDLLNKDDAELVVRGWEESEKYYFNIPLIYSRYIIAADFNGVETQAYFTGSEFAEKIEQAYVYTLENSSDGIEVEWNGYRPEKPYFTEISEPVKVEDKYLIDVKVDNVSDDAKEDAKMFVMVKDKHGKGNPMMHESDLDGMSSRYNTIEITAEEYEESEEIYIFFWDGMRPLCHKQPIK